MALVVAMAMVSVVPAVASAAPKQVDSFLGDPSDFEGGWLNGPAGVAVNYATGAVYVVDGNNNRVQQFDASNGFVRAWGKDVVVGGGAGFEVCEAGVDACQQGTPGSLGGELDGPQGIAIDQSDGSVYVTEQGNMRVQKFDAEGVFVRAFGRDVVVAGGAGDVLADPILVNERQSVQVGGPFDFGCFCPAPLTGGTFTLSLDGETTAGIPYDASGSAVAAALEALPSVGAGSVTVSGPTVDGFGFTAWMVEFTGALAGTDQPQMSVDGAFLEPSGASASVSTVEDGSATSQGPAEVCSDPSECKAGTSGTAGGEFGSTFNGYPAVVPDGAPNAGNVLVADPGNFRVQEFSATGVFVGAFGWDVAAPSAGAEDLGGGFEVCSEAVAGAANCTAGAPGDGSGQFGFGGPKRVAADATGAIYAVESDENFRVQKFVADGGPPGLGPGVFAPANVSGDNSTSPTDIAVDAAGERVYVAKGNADPFERRVLELTLDGALQDTHMANAGIDSVNGLAYRPSSGRVYVSSTTGGDRVYVLDDDGAPSAIANVSAASNVESTSATLSAQVNSNGPLATSYRLEYSRNGSSWTIVTDGSIDGGNTAQQISAQVTGLLPNVLYRVRIVTNKGYGSPDVPSGEGTFLTDSIPPETSGLTAAGVDNTTATLRASVNPHNTPTSYQFEYGVGSFNRRIPVPAASIGSGSSFVTVSEDLAGLEPNTTYQYRLVATSETEGTVTSQTKTFTTRLEAQSRGERSFELVSPPYKVSGIGAGTLTSGPGRAMSGSAAYDGERFAVGSGLGAMLLDSPFATASDWALAERLGDEAGWRSHSPVSHPFKGAQNFRMLFLQAASRDFSTLMWSSSGGTLPFFEEMTTIGHEGDLASLVSDWGDPPASPPKWEPIGPLALGQRTGSTTANVYLVPAISADGSHLAVSGGVRGLAGAGDPTLDTVGDLPGLDTNADTAYVDDISAGLSDSFPGAGVRTPAAACTGDDGGAGQPRTRIPVRDTDGNLDDAACAPKAANRDSRLVSDRGSVFTLVDASAQNIGTSVTNVISDDGSRAFFMAPDPGLNFLQNPGETVCVDETDATKCPTQLYVRQRNDDGEIVTRWISRPEPGLFDDSQPAELLGPTYFEGASADGSKVLFRTNSPLTADDPNGESQTPDNPNHETARGESSWDLYLLELDPGPDGDSSTPDGDPMGPGAKLTRVSAGPSANADCSTQPAGFGAALRFASEDASRVYFSCSAPLGGVADRATGTPAGVQGGTATTGDQTNLYLYDAGKADPADRWTFIARIPRTTGGNHATDEPLTRCASTAAQRGPSLLTSDPLTFNHLALNCWRGTSDGAFATFWTLGRLTADDPDDSLPGVDQSADFYAYDADSDELARISAPQGAVDETYACGATGGAAATDCYADDGMLDGFWQSAANPLLRVATDPAIPGDRIAFFESRSRLTNDDTDSAYDVYQWRNGDLSLISTGDSARDGAVYKGNSADGRNVYFATLDALTWQDVDAVLDIYSARVGGGIPQPPPPAPCLVLANGCQDGSAPPSEQPPQRTGPSTGDGNAPSTARRRIAIKRIGLKARLRAARTGVIGVRVSVNRTGPVRMGARAKIGGRSMKVGSAQKRVAEAGTTTMRLRLSGQATKALRQSGVLRVTLRVAQSGARTRSATVLLERGSR